MQNLKEIFKEAAEIAKQVPANMQEAAFNRAVDFLTGSAGGSARNASEINRKPNGTKKSKGQSSGAEGPKAADGKVRKGTNSLGPKSALEWLIANEFFATGKTGPQVQEFLKKKRGYDLGTAQLSTAMLRLVRDGQLERDENGDGHYEYKTP